LRGVLRVASRRRSPQAAPPPCGELALAAGARLLTEHGRQIVFDKAPLDPVRRLANGGDAQRNVFVARAGVGGVKPTRYCRPVRAVCRYGDRRLQLRPPDDIAQATAHLMAAINPRSAKGAAQNVGVPLTGAAGIQTDVSDRPFRKPPLPRPKVTHNSTAALIAVCSLPGRR
jgi:hypothetical protein